VGGDKVDVAPEKGQGPFPHLPRKREKRFLKGKKPNEGLKRKKKRQVPLKKTSRRGELSSRDQGKRTYPRIARWSMEGAEKRGLGLQAQSNGKGKKRRSAVLRPGIKGRRRYPSALACGKKVDGADHAAKPYEESSLSPPGGGGKKNTTPQAPAKNLLCQVKIRILKVGEKSST